MSHHEPLTLNCHASSLILAVGRPALLFRSLERTAYRYLRSATVPTASRRRRLRLTPRPPGSTTARPSRLARRREGERMGIFDSLRGVKKPPEGTAVLPRAELEQRLLGLNNAQVPFSVHTSTES